MIVVEKEFHGKKISFETGRVARQAGGAVLVRSGDSMVLVTACVGDEKPVDFLPLTIDYVEKTYAAGRIPGGFFRREGKLSEHETLTSRLIDRPCRPLFPEGFNFETQVIATVMSADPDVSTDILAVCGGSAALTLSPAPFEGPIAAVRVGRIGGKLVINPSTSELERSDMNFIVAGSRDAIVMVEGGAKQVPEAEVMEALFYAHKEMQVLIDMQLELAKKVGTTKIEFVPPERDQALTKKVTAFLQPKFAKAIKIADKLERRDALRAVKEELKGEFIKDDMEADAAAEAAKVCSKVSEDLLYNMVREMAFSEKRRIDGRDFTTVRPISIDLGILPRTHGSSLFTRGETQAIVVATLGTDSDSQRIDALGGEGEKTFMLHYNFPPFSVGETKPMRGPGRREVGHGALAERAVRELIPDQKDFPYVIRIVSEITESNGSSSMATVCGSSLALMDAGVPLKSAVAGVAMGLMKEGDKCAILTDILGDEDHLGDMDFKVCGTEKGITALQMDIKIKGLDQKIMGQALEQARTGRLHILGEMKKAISEPRSNMSKHAPRIVTMKINTEKIRDVIGPGGKTIRSITESTGVKMDVSDDGTINIASSDEVKLKAAMEIVRSLTAEAEIGKIYKGIVRRIADFGAFVEILPGTDGLVHISQLADRRVNRVTDVLNEGDEVYVKVLEVDRQGKIRLSVKEAQAEMAGAAQ
ncbi:MAG: polyribonucleotide nucleotidyltransferase [Oligoflexia bacterium]|nr:polyribonucleotide nucleotidyltransferase [Oligoflexia bacterium]